MNITKERFGGLLFLLLSIVYGYYATEIPGYPGDEYEPFTASTLPYALAGLGVLLSLLLMVSPGGEHLRKEPGDWRRVFILLGLMVIYGLGLTWFGFVLSTIAFLTVGIRVLGEPSLRYGLMISVPFSIGFWALLTKGLNVYLEPGRLFTLLGF